MKAYIAVSYKKRHILDEVMSIIIETLHTCNISHLIFVDEYTFDLSEEKIMMQKAMMEIKNCDFLIAETSEKGIGIGVEVGYAKALNKTIIYMRNSAAKHSSTVSGISDFQIIYDDIPDLRKKLLDTLISMNLVN